MAGRVDENDWELLEGVRVGRLVVLRTESRSDRVQAGREWEETRTR